MTRIIKKGNLIVRIRGGLGNQLFTYAFGFAMSKKNNLTLILDDYVYTTNISIRNLELAKLNITENKYFIQNHFQNILIFNKIYKIYNLFKRKIIYKCVYVKENKEIDLRDYGFSKLKNYYFNGFWQNHCYFDDYRDELKKEFTLKNISEKANEIINKISNGYCAVHIRRGDYISSDSNICLSLSYYFDAIEYIKIQKTNVKFLVFSDDISFCKKAFKDLYGIEYFEHYEVSDVEQLFIMKSCEYIIIANSTYSWWAAYLSNCKPQNIVCPVVDVWNEDYYLNNWEKITAQFEKL